jgi:hypothetical protein
MDVSTVTAIGTLRSPHEFSGNIQGGKWLSGVFL